MTVYTINKCELGYLIIAIIPFLQLFFKKIQNKNKKITITTNLFYFTILKEYFGDKIIGYDIKDYIQQEHRSGCSESSITTLYSDILSKLEDKYKKKIYYGFPYSRIERKILFIKDNKNKYISIFPCNRQWWTLKYRKFSTNFYNKIINYINENTNYIPIIISNYETIPDLNAEYILTQKKQIECLNNTAYLISPHSGFIDYSIICNISNAIILWKPYKKIQISDTQNYHNLLDEKINNVNITHLEDSTNEDTIFNSIKNIIKPNK